MCGKWGTESSFSWLGDILSKDLLYNIAPHSLDTECSLLKAQASDESLVPEAVVGQSEAFEK